MAHIIIYMVFRLCLYSIGRKSMLANKTFAKSINHIFNQWLVARRELDICSLGRIIWCDIVS